MDAVLRAVKAQGSKGDGEWWINWVLLDAEKVKDICINDILCSLYMFSHYSGPGKPFSHNGWVRRQNSRVLVTQRGGLDI